MTAEACSDMAMSRGTPGATSSWNRQGSIVPCRERGPADTWMLDFRPPELWEDEFLLFSVPRFLVLLQWAQEANHHGWRREKDLGGGLVWERDGGVEEGDKVVPGGSGGRAFGTLTRVQSPWRMSLGAVAFSSQSSQLSQIIATIG